MSWLQDQLDRYKERHPEQYARDKKNVRAGVVGLVIGLLLVGIVLAWTKGAFAAVACSSVTITPTGLSCEPTTAPPVTPPVTQPPVTPPVTPPNPYAACPAGTLIGGDVWGLTNINTGTAGAWGDGQVLVYRIVPTEAMSSVRNSTWAPYTGGGGSRDFSVTTQACDFSGVTAIGSSYAPNVKINGSSSYPQFYFRAGPNVGGQVNMEVGRVYYLNFRNPPGSCPSGNCVMVGAVPK